MLRGLEEFREHLGGGLTIMLLRAHRRAIRRARNRPGRYDSKYRTGGPRAGRCACGQGSQAAPPDLPVREAVMTPHPRSSPLSATELVDEYFIENRNRLLDIAAFLDRIDRADPACAATDFRMRAFAEALGALAGAPGERIVTVQMLFSDPTHRAARRARSQGRRWAPTTRRSEGARS